MKGKPKSGVKQPKGQLTLREVADLLGVSHGTVANLERSALKKLRDGLRDWGPDR